MNILKHISLSILFLATICACGKKDEPNPPSPDAPSRDKMTVIFYDVASEAGMASNYEDDIREVKDAAKFIDLDNFNLLIYSVYPEASGLDPDLQILEKDNLGQGILRTIKNYDRTQFSTDPERITDVINSVISLYPAESYGMILAAHGTAWSPKNSDHIVPEPYEPQVQKAFGGDQYAGATDWTDLHELAFAIPDNTFEFLWFDACYMSAIEVIYQLRNKCNVFIGYPTEIFIEGMPYDETLPLLLQEQPDYVAAATATFNWYNVNDRAVTIGVYDMTKIEPLADASAKAYANYDYISSRGVLRYSRFSTGPFYELKDYTHRMAAQNCPDFDINIWDSALNEFTIYAAASKLNFSNIEIPADIYSGINCHLFQNLSSSQDDYYRSLDWFKRVYDIAR